MERIQKILAPRVNRIEDGKTVTLENLDTGLVEIFEYDNESHDHLISYKANDGRWQRIYRFDDGKAYRYEDSSGIVEIIDYREGHIVHRKTDKYGHVEYWVEDYEDY